MKPRRRKTGLAAGLERRGWRHNWLSKLANAVWSRGLAIRSVVLGAVALLPFVLGLLPNVL